MKSIVKENLKKLLIWFIVVILVTAYMPIGEVYAYAKENNEISQESLDTEEKEETKSNEITKETSSKETNEVSGEKTTEIENTEDVQDEDSKNEIVNNNEDEQEEQISSAVSTMSTLTAINTLSIQNNEDSNKSSDLREFITSAQILQNGEPVTGELNVNETYQIKLEFNEVEGGKQFGLNSYNQMTYQLPEEIKVLQNIYGQEIKAVGNNGTEMKVGTYSITTDGLVTIKWDHVDLDNNPTDNWYIDNYENVSLTLNFDSNFKSTSYGEQIPIEFGDNIVINVTFIEQHDIVVNKSAEINESGSKYDIDTHTINYNVEVINYGDMKPLYLEDSMDSNLELDMSKPITISYEYLDATIKTFTIPDPASSSYVTATDNGFILNLTPDGETVPDQTQIKVNYTVKLKDSAFAGDGVVNLDAKNTVTVKGTDSNNKEVSDTDDETVSIHNALINKSGEIIKAGDPELNNEKDVIKWAINLGDGYSPIGGIRLTDTLGGDLSYATDLPCTIILYEKNGNATTLNKSLKESVEINGNEFYYTIPSDKVYYKAEIYYYTYFEAPEKVDGEYVSTSFFRNTVKGTIIGQDVETTGNVTIDGVRPEINKHGSFDKNTDTISYSIDMSIPKSYNGQVLYLKDVTNITKNNNKYNVNYGSFVDAFEKSLRITATTESGEEITFVNSKNDSSAPYTYSIKYLADGGMYILFNTSSQNESSSRWNIDETALVHLEYDVPLDDAVVIDGSDNNNTLEQYLGGTVTNTITVVGANNVGGYSDIVSDDFDIRLPVNLEKTYREFGNNTNIAIFDIVVNEAKRDFLPNDGTLTVVDTMSKSLDFLDNTLKIYEYNDATQEYDIEVEGYTVTHTTGDNGEDIVTISNLPDETHFRITYNCLVIGTGKVDITNLAEIKGVGNTTSKVEEEFEMQNSSAVSGASDTGISFSILKYGENNGGNTPLGGVEFVLFDEQGNVVGTPVTGNDGKITLSKMGKGTYRLRELYTPDSYIKLDGDIVITIGENQEGKLAVTNVTYEGNAGSVGLTQDGKDVEIVNQKQEYISIPVTKTWVNDQDNKYGTRPDTITINLLRNGTQIDSKAISATNNWTYTFENLPKYDEEGEAYTYEVKEISVNGYTTTYNTTANGVNITNTLETTSVSGIKTWNDDLGAYYTTRPESITVNLLSDGQKIDSKVVTADNNWQYTFTGIPKYNAEGKEAVYTVSEDAVTGYTPRYDGMNIENSTETTEVTVTKTWNDSNNNYGTRPESITVNLFRNGKQIDIQTISPDKDGNWSYTFTNLPEYDARGNKFTYTVTEDSVTGYTTEINGTNITNTLETTSVSGEKTWNDYNNKYGIRPESIIVNVVKKGTTNVLQSQEVKVNSDGNWTYTFTGLPKYEADGTTLAQYEVTENAVNGYSTQVTGTNITNSLITTNVKVTKTWNDFENKYEIRPDTITVNLLRNGEKFGDSVELTKESGWEYTFTNLPKYDAQGQEYTYTVSEDTVNGYTYTTANTADGINITNTLKKTNVKVTKSWSDFDNKNEIRPDTITVNLLRNEEKFGDSVELTAESGWEYTFTDLPKYDAQGHEYTYTVTENKVNGYTYTTTNTADGINITNTLETTNISGTKTWDDYDDKYEIRPDTITVNLLRNGETYISQEVSADASENWSYTFTNLPKYDKDGNEYSYTVTENAVNGYETSISGTNITNKLITTKVSGLKTWLDNGNKDGTRPESITVNLYRNGDFVESKVVTAETGWMYEFTNLPVYNKDGSKSVYTVREDALEGYTPTYSGMDITNSVNTINLSGTKTWNDENNRYSTRPESIIINLFRNGTYVESKTVTAADGWAYTFTNLPEYDAMGRPFNYTVREDDVNGYETQESGMSVTNTLITKDVSGTKTWEDYNNVWGIRPTSIIVNVVKEGTTDVLQSQTVTPDADGNWKYTFTGLPKLDKDGNEIEYTVTENEVYGYEATVTGMDITNTLETTSVSGTKTWVDNDNASGLRPESVTVNLLRNNIPIDSRTVSEETGWAYEFTNLPKYDAEGNEYAYTITENAVNGYEERVNGTNVTNTLITTDVVGTKIWNDNNNYWGLRPDAITVNLLRNGDVIDSKIVSAQNNWLYMFNSLPKYDADGNEYTYTVEENPVTGYNAQVAGNNIINTLDTTEVTVTKTWDDQNNKFDTRPDSITVNLYKDGEQIASQEVKPDASGNWSYTFTNLPKVDAEGNEYEYTVTENGVTGYDTQVSGNTITNTLETTSVRGVKTWLDNCNVDGTRPTSITVNLLRNGTEVDSKTVTAETGWMYEFTNLPVYNKDGSKSVYTVNEEELIGYSPTYDGINIENSVKTISLSGSKTWNDQDNKYSTRPQSITINLFRNGKPVESKVVTAADNWAYTFTNLPEYDAMGRPFNYTVREDNVNGYETAIDGMNVTNTLITTNVTGAKTWEDNNDAWGLRPESITVNLLRNGEQFESQTVTAETGWTYEFDGLPKYDANGNEYTYTVSENTVNGYEAEVSETNITNTLITTNVTGTKTWEDNDNYWNLRPDTIIVNLLRNGEQIDSQTVTEDSDWSYEFTNLPKYDADGNEYVYTVTENPVIGYEAEVSGTNIINTLITTDVTGTKTWTDSNNKYGTRPESITVNLFRDGEPFGSQEVTAENGWTYTFTNLPKYDAEGNEYVYTLTENEVTGYETSISGTNITNALITTKVSGTKTWDDNDDIWELRPESITVNLFANGDKIDSKVVTGEGNSWTYEFTDIPKYDKDGKEIVYTITEDAVNNYTTTIDGYDITNKLIEPEKPALLNYFGEWPMATKKDLFNTPKTGNENFLGSFIITAILSAMGIVIIKKNNRDKE